MTIIGDTIDLEVEIQKDSDIPAENCYENLVEYFYEFRFELIESIERIYKTKLRVKVEA